MEAASGTAPPPADSKAAKPSKKDAGNATKKDAGNAASGKAPKPKPKKEKQGGGKGASESKQGGGGGAGKGAKKARNAIAPQQVSLFSHLPEPIKTTSYTKNVCFSENEPIHPAFLRLGLRFSEGRIRGSNARCLAFLDAMKRFIHDYDPPENAAISRSLERSLRPQIDFLRECRPPAAAMGNTVRYLKGVIAKVPVDMELSAAKSHLIERIDWFIKYRIEVSDPLCYKLLEDKKIVNGDVVLVYARSLVVEQLMIEARHRGIDFRVIVVDSRPWFEGRTALKHLTQEGVECSYVLLNSVSYVMKDVTKVIVGASAMMSNGNVLSRVGTGLLATVANAYKKPVIVCCETYKFCDRVQIDAITANELAEPTELVEREAAEKDRSTVAAEISEEGKQRTVDASLPLADYKSIDNLAILNVVYDLTPADMVTLVATEIGLLPPSSVPAIIREFSKL